MPLPTSAECVDAAETGLGALLPAPWRERLLRSNGGGLSYGEEEWSLFPVQDRSDRKRAARTANHLVRENEAARSWEAFPPAAIAVGENGYGDYLVLLRDSSARQQLADLLYRWDHETGQLIALGPTGAVLNRGLS